MLGMRIDTLGVRSAMRGTASSIGSSRSSIMLRGAGRSSAGSGSGSGSPVCPAPPSTPLNNLAGESSAGQQCLRAVHHPTTEGNQLAYRTVRVGGFSRWRSCRRSHLRLGPICDDHAAYRGDRCPDERDGAGRLLDLIDGAKQHVEACAVHRAHVDDNRSHHAELVQRLLKHLLGQLKTLSAVLTKSVGQEIVVTGLGAARSWECNTSVSGRRDSRPRRWGIADTTNPLPMPLS
jgi:hypothetical protein